MSTQSNEVLNEVQSEENFYDPEVFSLKEGVGTEFITNFVKDFKLEALRDKINKICEQSMSQDNRTPIVSFCSEKGGSGKTTSALCVMQLVANLGFKVLLVDVDPARGSSNVVNARKALITSQIEQAQEQGIDVGAVVEFKRGIEPVIDALEIAPSNFNAAVVQEIAQKKDYDLIVIDTAGLKIDTAANFDIRQLSTSGKPHITTAYTSNLVIVPTGTSNIDLNIMIAYVQPLLVFINTLQAIKRNIVKTQYRVLANRIERGGSGLKELAEAKEEVLFNWFDKGIRRSEKISANTSTKHSDTVFTTKVAKQITEAYINTVSQIFDDIEVSLER